MGYSIYSSKTRAMYSNIIASKSENEIFTQNLVRKVHDEMSPIGLGIRESRDSEIHPNTLPIIIALDVTGSMGRIPQNIIKKDLTHLMESLIHGIGIPDVAVMFLAIGDQNWDKASLQVGQFESGDQELAKWLSSTYIEHGGGGDRQESYAYAWMVAGNHTATDSWEKRKQKGFLFTIGDEGFHEECNVNKVIGSGQVLNSRDVLVKAKQTFEVFHIHANHGNYPDNRFILDQWKDALGQNLIIAKNDKEIIDSIINTIKSNLQSKPVKNEENIQSEPSQSNSDEPEIL